jgi:hypothetical protein
MEEEFSYNIGKKQITLNLFLKTYHLGRTLKKIMRTEENSLHKKSDDKY